MQDWTGMGKVGEEIGDNITIWVKTKEDWIEDITFEAKGSCALIAVGSAIAKLADKKRIPEAFCMTIQEINQQLELPWEKIECIEVGRRALQKAIMQDYQKKGKEIKELCQEENCKIESCDIQQKS